MSKYLEIPVMVENEKTGVTVEVNNLICTDDILYCALENNELVKLYLKGANSYIELQYKVDEGRTATSADLVKAVNDALIVAAETIWTKVTSKVIVPPGMELGGLSVN